MSYQNKVIGVVSENLRELAQTLDEIDCPDTPVSSLNITRIREASKNITGVWESRNTDCVYQTADAGVISVNRYQVTLMGFDTNIAKQHERYLSNGYAEHASAVGKYLPRVQGKDGALAGDPAYKALWVKLCDESANLEAHHYVVNRDIWDAMYTLSVKPRGIKLAWSMAVIFDIALNNGVRNNILSVAEERIGISHKQPFETLADEQAFIRSLVQTRMDIINTDGQAGLARRYQWYIDQSNDPDFNWVLSGDGNGELAVLNYDVQVADPEIPSYPYKPAITPPAPPAEIRGINIDPYGGIAPAPASIAGVSMVRFAINIAQYRGQTTDDAMNFYAPYIENYHNAGMRVCLVLNHQTGFEGRPYELYKHGDGQLVDPVQFASTATMIADRFKHLARITIQIWNEPDAPPSTVASIPLLPETYGLFLNASDKIKTIAPHWKVITAGMTGGAVAGSLYAVRAGNNSDHWGKIDAVAFHPYGRATGTFIDVPPYGLWGTIEESIAKYRQNTGKPVIVTEWGVLDVPDESPDRVNDYATQMLKTFRSKQVEAVWFAYGQQHNAYGVVSATGLPIQPLHSTLIEGA